VQANVVTGLTSFLEAISTFSTLDAD
jgi:hypothetical protein